MSKKDLVTKLLSSNYIDQGTIHTENPEWKKPAEKIKNGFLIQEAAKGIAKKKIEIQLLAEEKYFLISAKLGLQIDKLSVSCDKNTEKNEKLLKRKEDLEAKYKGLHEENMKILTGKEKDLQKKSQKT